MLGIIIGVAAVITLVSIGRGLQNVVNDEFQGFGSNLLFVFSVNPGTSAFGSEQSTSTRNALGLSNQDAEAIADPVQAPDVAAVLSAIDRGAVVKFDGYEISTAIEGTTPEFPAVRDWKVIAGRFISENDIDSEARVAVLGVSVVEDLFTDGTFPIDQTIRINNLPFRVIGIMEEKGATFGNDQDNIVYIPISTAQTRLFNSRRRDGQPQVDFFTVQASSEEGIEAATNQTTDILRERHNINFRDEDDFQIVTQSELLSAFEQITVALTLFLGVIAGISLLVGGIGIMNIMLVSVTERTREIGLRKAVGARRRDILVQFLVEAMVLSVLGGLLGIALGSGASLAASSAIDGLSASISLSSVLTATLVSAMIGIFFGIFPAYRAARLNPIDALRYE